MSNKYPGLLGGRPRLTAALSLSLWLLCLMSVIFTFPAPLSASEGSVSSADTAAVSLDVPLPPDAAVSGDISAVADGIASHDVLPEIYKVSIDMLSRSNQINAEVLTSSVKALLAENKVYEASKTLGTAFGIERRNSYRHLGWYCIKVLPYLGGGLDEEVKFLTGFVSGYGKSGLLIITREGVENIRVYGGKRGTQWRTVPDNLVPADKYDRIYGGAKSIYIPFAAGETFKADMYGAPTGTARVWKILSNGVNTKSWEGGMWEREITVRGDKIF